MPSILLLGDINVDVLMDVPVYPPPGGEAVTERLITRLGGSAANTAVVLSRLGLEARMLGRVGSDPWGQLALAALAEAGVGLELVQQDEAVATGLMFTAVTPDGERTMFGQRGANPLTDPSAISPDILGGADLLYLSGYALLEVPQREAAARGWSWPASGGCPSCWILPTCRLWSPRKSCDRICPAWMLASSACRKRVRCWARQSHRLQHLRCSGRAFAWRL